MPNNDFATQSIILIHKPEGPTSHDIVAIARRKLGIKKIGHAGTLDPFASGLLILLIGREGTKQQASFMELDKTYEATIVLGSTSTTDDKTGVLSAVSCNPPSSEDITNCLKEFLGEQEQVPSLFSAKKINGVRAYTLARRGETPELKPKKVTFHSIDFLFYEWPRVHVRLTVSSGTYIRAFARDLGKKLSCGGYVEELKRTAIGPYQLENARTLEDL